MATPLLFWVRGQQGYSTWAYQLALFGLQRQQYVPTFFFICCSPCTVPHVGIIMANLSIIVLHAETGLPGVSPVHRGLH